jgi:hypothetical protein
MDALAWGSTEPATIFALASVDVLDVTFVPPVKDSSATVPVEVNQALQHAVFAKYVTDGRTRATEKQTTEILTNVDGHRRVLMESASKNYKDAKEQVGDEQLEELASVRASESANQRVVCTVASARRPARTRLPKKNKSIHGDGDSHHPVCVCDHCHRHSRYAAIGEGHSEGVGRQSQQ